MFDCSICNKGFPTENYVVVNAVFQRISKVKKEVLTPLQLNCHHIFHYSCLSQKFHEQVCDESKRLICPTCHTFIDIGKDNAPWGVYFTSKFEMKIFLKNEEIVQWKEEKVDTFYIGEDCFTDVQGIFQVVD